MSAGDNRTQVARLAIALLIAVIVIVITGMIVALLSWSSLEPADSLPIGPVGAVVYASLGTVVIRRVLNRIGWLLLAEGALQVVIIVMSAYAMFGIVHPGSVPAAERPGLQVLRFLRRGLSVRGREDHRDPDPGSASERVRGAVGPHGPDRVPGLGAGLRSPPPRADPSDLYGSLQRAKVAPRP
jgi:hypothetical protein